MFYYCPYCNSKIKPVIVKYFPPISVKCLECGYMNLEYKFIKEDNKKSLLLHYTH